MIKFKVVLTNGNARDVDCQEIRKIAGKEIALTGLPDARRRLATRNEAFHAAKRYSPYRAATIRYDQHWCMKHGLSLRDSCRGC